MIHDQIAESLSRAYKNVFLGVSDSREGMLVLADLINKCCLFTVNTKSPNEALVLEAKKAIGIYLFQQVGLSKGYGGQIDLIELGSIIQVFQGAHESAQMIRQAAENLDKEQDNA
jgi:hypothetical protein